VNRQPIRWWNRLGVKLAGATAAVGVVTLAAFLLLVLQAQRQHLVEQARRSAAIVSDTITGSLEHEMLLDRRDDAYRIMEAIGRQDQVEHLRLFDARGTIRFSTDAHERGATVDLGSEPCRSCHRDGAGPATLSVADRTRVGERGGDRVLTAITPIYNRRSCAAAACHAHPEDQRIIGVVEVTLGLAALDRGTAQLARRTTLLSFGATVVLALVTLVLMRRFVVRPITGLVAGVRRVSAGDLDQRVPVGAADEFGVLENAFNEMEHTLARTSAERNDLLNTLERQVADRTAALERAQAQLIQTEKLTSLGKLSASIAHEINNPLAGILTTAKLLLRTLDEQPKDARAAALTRSLRLVERETERCAAIVRNLLGFARERPLTLAMVDVNTAIEEALFLIGNQTALQNVTIERHLEPLPSIDADFGQVRQAFANIVINACDAMPSGGTLRVQSRHVVDAGLVEVTVTDTGIGIPPDQLSKVVDPFFTTKEKGTGLGLSVVFGIVERHAGRLTIDSHVGVGTTVTITLPIAAARRVPPPDTRDRPLQTV
jgi:two-component system, NtrC family, sensor kinase